MSFGDGGFVALVPVKPPAIGKSRLGGVADRAALARAIAIDTICAARDTAAVARVLVVTESDDSSGDAFGEEVRALGVEVCADPGGGLNAALRAGSAVARGRWPALRPVALLADLPALTPDLLDTALASVAGGPAYCSDAEGTGTTLYTAAYDDFDPRFGAGSAAAHRDAGGVPIGGVLAGLRRDVDDAESLAAARVLGLGPATSALLESVPK
ncbi:MAG TPA: 2-phospho-L-lactate guanylyltransferase [Nocardioides sp.]|nr:2-phospho-L-lactate guanylyltransferase [Nocardioides sp.]